MDYPALPWGVLELYLLNACLLGNVVAEAAVMGYRFIWTGRKTNFTRPYFGATI